MGGWLLCLFAWFDLVWVFIGVGNFVIVGCW